MVDRIAEIRGTRAPFAQRERWPVRLAAPQALQVAR